MLTPIHKHLGLFRDQHTGQVFNRRDFHPWETSEIFVGLSWAKVFSDADLVIAGWRFTVPVWPQDVVEVQQRVTLVAQEKILSVLSLSSLLTCVGEIDPQIGPQDQSADRYRRNRKAEMLDTVGVLVRRQSLVEVQLEERPVEIGLRLHLYGMVRAR